MKRIAILALALTLPLLAGAAGRALAQAGHAHDHGHDHAHDHARDHAAGAGSPLERLKALAGTWEGTAQHGEQKFPTTVTWRVTGGGSAVTETLFAGTEHEMLTVYTVQDGRVVLTHYCAGGNQPFMRQAPGGKGGEMAFDYAGGANLDPAKDPHMHSGRIAFLADDRIRTEWQSWEGGKPTTKAIFDLQRRK